MDSRLESLVEKDILLAGIITRTEDDFIAFQRIYDIEELKRLEAEGKELGFATKTMGRAIFKVNEAGRVENYKGVDSRIRRI